MKNNKGITLMSLVIAILLLFIISSVAVNTGINVYNQIRVENFISKMKLIQAKVDNISEETNDFSSYDFTKLTEGTLEYKSFEAILKEPEKYNINTSKSWNSELDSNIENYYYFSASDVEKKLGVKDIEEPVIINFETRNVISRDGVLKDKQYYYRQYDLSGGDQLINK